MLKSAPKTSTTVMEISTAVIGSAKRSRKMGSACKSHMGLSISTRTHGRVLQGNSSCSIPVRNPHLCGCSIAKHQCDQQEVGMTDDLQGQEMP